MADDSKEIGGAANALDDLDDDQIPHGFMCPITSELMSNPVYLHADGRSYEKAALDKWFATGRLLSPMTGLKIGSTNYKPNYNLKHAIDVSASRCFAFARSSIIFC